MISIRKISALLVAMSLTGCGIYQKVRYAAQDVEQDGAGMQDELARLRKTERKLDITEYVRQHPGAWVPTSPLQPQGDAAQATKKIAGCRVMFAPWQPVGLPEFGQQVTKWCGVPVYVAQDALDPGKPGQPGADGRSDGGAPFGPAPPLSQMIRPPSDGAGGSPTSISGIKYEGNLSGLLDQVTARLGLAWKIANGGIHIHRLDTELFSLQTICSTAQLTSAVSSGTTIAAGSGGASSSGSGGSGGGSSQNATISNKTDICGDLEKTVKSLLTPGGRAQLALSTNTISVTDTPQVLRRVARYLDAQKKQLGKQVLFNVKVLSVKINDSDRLGIDWNLVRQMGGGALFKFGGNLAGYNVPDTVETPNRGNKWQGTNTVIEALSRQGKVSEVISPSITTLNLQPAPLQIGNQISYLAQSAVTRDKENGNTYTLTPGSVTTGFNMTLLPHVTEDNQVLLQYSMNISALDDMKTFGPDDNKIQLPDISNRIFNQSVRLQSGQTLIMGGFEKSSKDAGGAGIGGAWNVLLGGKVESKQSRDIIVLLITPVVI